MKKWLIIVGIAVLALGLLLASAWLWLTRSEGGARWTLNQATGAVERLDYDSLSGGLLSGLRLDGIRFEHAGARVDAEELALELRIDLFSGPRVVVQSMRGEGIDIYLPEAQETDEPAAEPFDLSALASPIEVVIDELALRRIAIHGEGEPLRIQSFDLAGRYGDRLEIEQLAVVADAGRATAQGQWALERRGSGRLELDASTKLDNDAGQSAALVVEGRIDALEFELSTSGPVALDGQGRVRGLPGAAAIEAQFRGGLTDWPGLPVTVADLSFSLSGEPNNWRAESSARVSGDDIPAGDWQLAVSGSTQAMTIESLEANILDGRISGDGRLDWSESAPASSARLTLESLDLTPLYPQWPNQGRIGGELVVSTQAGVIEVESLELAADPGDLSVTGAGRIDPAGDSVDVTLEWQQFAWPPVTDDSEPLVASESGRLHLEGRISDWRAELDAMLDSPQSPPARIEARASGSREAANIERLTIDAGESGSLALDGRIAWAPSLSAGVTLALEGFDPGIFVSQLPGSIDGKARIDLSRDERWQATIGLERLGGELRGQAIEGTGQLAWVDDQPESADVTLSLGDNRIDVSSSEAATWEVALEAVSLDQLWPALEGEAELSGSLDPAAGRLELSGNVSALRYENYDLEQADLVLSLAWLGEPEVDLVARASNLDLQPWDRVEKLELTLVGSCAQHQLRFESAGARGNIDLAADGGLADCLDGEREWRGQLTRLSLFETLAGDWRLSEAVDLAASQRGVQARNACLATAADTPARLCLEELEVGETGRVLASVEQVPMDLLLLPLDPVFSLTTPLSGRIEAGWDSAGLSTMDGQLRLSAGVLKAIDGEQDLLAIDGVQVDFEPGEGTALGVTLNARLEGDTEINGRARLADLRQPTDTTLEGEARLDLPDISAFGHLIPNVDRIGGSAMGRIEITGPVTGPAMSGRLAIDNGELAHAPLGLDVSAIALELSGSADQASLRGRAESGEGELRLDGQASLLDEGWRLESRLEGERFAFAGADWLELTASPQISLSAQPERVDIDGDIRIDRLRGGLPPGAAERVAASPDVEVVGEEAEDDETEAAIERRRVEGRLGIDLGDNASLATEGFQTQLAGELELVWRGPARPQGRGTLRLPEGSYRAYGQNLEINGGEVIFSGQPIDDPRLDIRAVRDIFGDPKVETAGVHIGGSAQRPEIELYTDPPTSDEKALAYVVTGSDFDHAGGQGALNVGFYLLPKLFVSYGVGLFETGNVLSGRYEFSRRWGVRVVSGERDTGVDLSFTVDN
ncbi:translocation/assembly module TamB domain-containing protein [Wenzhouxiangella sp. EGI_FJ10409]|uniref:translocation/assembly module TamB domain-containing protein n=1 Tax=Wenzhouxiangella sp. EGI_FJ10409 TaxID=3243767 RepID=UPI0035DC2912